MPPAQLDLPISSPAPPILPAVPPPPYVVALRDCPGITVRERMAAELRCCAALERKLGPPEVIAAIVRTLQAVEANEGTPPANYSELVRRWRVAYTSARLAGLQDLASITDAWFDVQASQ